MWIFQSYFPACNVRVLFDFPGELAISWRGIRYAIMMIKDDDG